MRSAYSATKEKPVISVWLDDSRPTAKKEFHCPICGRRMFDYYSDVKIMVPGSAEEAQERPLEVQCKTTWCKCVIRIS